MAARAAAKSANSLEALRAILDRFDGCALKASATQLVFADGNPQAQGDVRRRSARPRRGHRGSALRRALRQTARPHAGGDRPRPHLGLHRQHRALAAARQPHADAAGVANLPALHPAPDRARRSRYPGLPRRLPRRRRCSASRKASPRRAGAGSPSTPANARSAPCRLSIRPFCCAARCRSASPGAISWRSRRRSGESLAVRHQQRPVAISATPNGRRGAVRPIPRQKSPPAPPRLVDWRHLLACPILSARKETSTTPGGEGPALSGVRPEIGSGHWNCPVANRISPV